jgi:hypothetical protein
LRRYHRDLAHKAITVLFLQFPDVFAVSVKVVAEFPADLRAPSANLFNDRTVTGHHGSSHGWSW